MFKYFLIVNLVILPIVIAADNFTLKNKEVYCLALNMYHEARGETDKGALAVAFVTMNRVRDYSFPNTVCGVVFQKIKKKCQFSWVCRKYDKSINDKEKFQELLKLAKKVYNGEYSDFTRGAKYFHNVSVYPKWAKTKNKTIKIGQHIFYK